MAAIGQLAGGVAHDFNNLLTIISGHAELLLAGLSPEAPMRDSLAQICGATSRAASLTRQLLAFSRKQPSEPRIVELNRLIRETQQMFRRVLGKEIVLDTLLSPQLSRVKIDPSQMDQVILNLVVNARDAMTGGGRLTIQTLNVELNESSLQGHSGIRPGSYVALVVRDTGCGMNAEVKAQIFEPFFTTKAAGKGTGLGLAVVQDIVKRAGGHISVHSEPGIGTTFKIYLPAARRRSTPISQDSGETNRRGSETVLLVEDEDALRHLGAVVLEDYGYTVLTATNAKQAMRLASRRKLKIHLLLTDVAMPGINGCELASTLRRQQPDLRVLFLSGYTEDAVRRRGTLDGDAAFLNKPFTPASLAAKVRRILDDKRANVPTSSGAS
jgi:CheY-like chemotaxis protein/two-component sensor histidine kinase